MKFEDPFERAFTVDIPTGWTAKGGLFRLGFDDWRPMLDLRSPDGAINVRMGDVAVPSYTIPVPYHMTEGEPYDLGAQAIMTVAKYRSGQEFAVLYARARFRTLCQSPIVIPSDQPPPVSSGSSSGGQVTLQCGTGRDAQIAYVYARTEITGTIWKPSLLASFIAPVNQVATAREVVLRCSQSSKISPEWTVHQRQMTEMGLQYQRAHQQGRINQLGQQVRQFENRMKSMQNQVRAFQNHQNTQAGQVADFTNILAGVTPTYDPLTGQSHQTWTGPKSGYWINGRGERVNSDVSPGPGWRPLQH